MTPHRLEEPANSTPVEVAEYRRASSKAEAVARMYFLGGRVVEPLGPGSKEKKSALVALGRFVDLDLTGAGSKVACGRAIAETVDTDWIDVCYSAGDTITLYGLNRLLEGALRWRGSRDHEGLLELLRELETIEPAPRWYQRLEDDTMALDISEIEQNVAEQLAELHQQSSVPEGVDAPSSEFERRGTVSVTSGSWRTALASVQGWLHLSGSIDETDSARFDQSLADLLGLGASASTSELLERLLARLERATSLRAKFLVELEDEAEGAATLKTASAHWREGWEDVEETDESEASGPIRASTEVWPITQFRQYAGEGDLELSPSYQRADVWPTGDAQLLIESILRGIPLPSVILLEKQTEGSARYEIVDGKQRLTAILRFTAAHPRALATVAEKASKWPEGDRALDLFRHDYPAFRALWRKNEVSSLTARVEKDLYFPFPLRSGDVPSLSGDLEHARGRYYSEIRNLMIETAGKRRRIRAIFEEHVEYRIPVITYEQVTSQQVHEVFSLYNKQGKHLNAEEIRNAAFHELGFMRALLVTAGDSTDVGAVAPFLQPHWHRLSSSGQNLGTYGIADAGYKRTKTLSWLSSALLSEDERLESRSTAAHINNFLKRIQDDPRDPLRSEERICRAMLLLDAAVAAHVSIEDEVWATRFRNAQNGAKWQELQLVASLIALAAAAAVHGDALQSVVDDALDEISECSERWTRPKKTQSREQWRYIGSVVRDFTRLLSVDVKDADRRLRQQFGTAGLEALVALPESD